MKTKITTAFLTIAAAFGFAQEAIPEVLPTLAQLEVTPSMPSIHEKVSSYKSFGYLRMGVSDTKLRETDINVLPGFGVGYRLVAGSSAIDLSASFNQMKRISDNLEESTFHYTLPKVSYLYYLNAKSNNSLYAGLGLAWGGVSLKKDRDTVEIGEDGSLVLKNEYEKDSFIGLIPNVAIGYELNRNGILRSFIQLDVSQPAIAASKEGAFPKAFAELAFGAGF